MSDEKYQPLWHQSGLNIRGEPFVQLIQGETVIGQMSAEEARAHAQAVLESAEASEQDAFMFDFARHQIGLDDQGAMRLIMAFREYRAKASNKRGGPTRPEDWVMPPEDKRGE